MHERGATGYSLSVDGGACSGVQGVGGTGVGVVTGADLAPGQPGLEPLLPMLDAWSPS